MIHESEPSEEFENPGFDSFDHQSKKLKESMKQSCDPEEDTIYQSQQQTEYVSDFHKFIFLIFQESCLDNSESRTLMKRTISPSQSFQSIPHQNTHFSNNDVLNSSMNFNNGDKLNNESCEYFSCEGGTIIMFLTPR